MNHQRRPGDSSVSAETGGAGWVWEGLEGLGGLKGLEAPGGAAEVDSSPVQSKEKAGAN